jgi:hypothetical protein
LKATPTPVLAGRVAGFAYFEPNPLPTENVYTLTKGVRPCERARKPLIESVQNPYALADPAAKLIAVGMFQPHANLVCEARTVNVAAPVFMIV